MYRLWRAQATSSLLRRYSTPATKSSTGITGLSVHPDPLPTLLEIYKSNLSLLGTIPETAVYRQSLEALLKKKIKHVDVAIAGQGVESVENELQAGQIEEILESAVDELKLTEKMLEWKPYVLNLFFLSLSSNLTCNCSDRWEPLEEKPSPEQWVYFGVETRS
jgi:NADH dehydrogenase (ubiquinone) 1 alpha subcomplex subunit 5